MRRNPINVGSVCTCYRVFRFSKNSGQAVYKNEFCICLLMKKIILFILTTLISGSVFAQYKPIDQGSSLQFTIKNFGFDVTGEFTGLQGDISFDPQNPSTGGFDVSIDAATVNTDNSLRDHHLHGDTYFDVKNYPKIHFVSTKVSGAKNGVYSDNR